MKKNNKKEIALDEKIANYLISFAVTLFTSTPVPNGVFSRLPVKVVAILTILSLNAFGFVAIGESLAMFSDSENSNENIFEAAQLDFYLSNTEENEFLGVEVYGNLQFATVAIQEAESLDIRYSARAEKVSGDDNFCASIDLIAKHNGAPVYEGNVLGFSAEQTATFGTWEFELDSLPQTADYAHGDVCNVDFVFDGWRDDVADPSLSGFDDEERFRVNMTSRMIVLNEYLPNPIGNECSGDGEWVELYNNGNKAIDLSGWEIRDDNGSATPISVSNTMSATTTIGAKGSGSEWLVVNLDSCVLNNDGDSVNLYDDGDMLVDSRTYSTTAPENKSDARIPDGIGAWVDPVPTPGGPNKLDGDDELDLDTNKSSQTQDENSDSDSDTEAPVITINGNNPAYVPVGATYNDLGATVSDNVNDNLGVYTEGGQIDTSSTSTHRVIYTARDQAGNEARAERIVFVYLPSEGIPSTDNTGIENSEGTQNSDGQDDTKESVSVDSDEKNTGEDFAQEEPENTESVVAELSEDEHDTQAQSAPANSAGNDNSIISEQGQEQEGDNSDTGRLEGGVSEQQKDNNSDTSDDASVALKSEATPDELNDDKNENVKSDDIVVGDEADDTDKESEESVLIEEFSEPESAVSLDDEEGKSEESATKLVEDVSGDSGVADESKAEQSSEETSAVGDEEVSVNSGMSEKEILEEEPALEGEEKASGDESVQEEEAKEEEIATNVEDGNEDGEQKSEAVSTDSSDIAVKSDAVKDAEEKDKGIEE